MKSQREDTWFRVGFALCTLVALVVIGVAIWAVITLVGHVAR